MLFWIWLHLLVENISNQRLPDSIIEDRLNKPWRPLVAGHLTPSEANSLLRFCVLLAIITSTILRTLSASTALMVFIWLYNDMGGSGADPMVRNALNAAGLSCFGWGSVLVLFGSNANIYAFNEQDWQQSHLRLAVWIALSAVIITTTVHAQDFPDLEGDQARGRKTMPLLYGDMCSRWLLAIPIIAWSVVCPAFWHVASPLVWSVSLLLGFGIAFITVMCRSAQANQLVWQLWCVWITFIYLLPLSGSMTL